jgi:hypothetical protein
MPPFSSGICIDNFRLKMKDLKADFRLKISVRKKPSVYHSNGFTEGC